MTISPTRHVHISARSGQRRTAPGTALSPTTVPDPRPGAIEIEARGFVVYVGMEEAAAFAAGTSLDRLATELRRYVDSIVPVSQSAATVVIAPAAAPGPALEVVRRVLGDPTIPPGTGPHLLQAPAAAPTRQAGLVIDLVRRQMQLDGEGVHLTRTEFELLHCLVENRDRSVGRAELLGSLWKNAKAAPSERSIDVHIRRLRTKLGRLSGIVHTARGQGYRFPEHPDVTVREGHEYDI
jgi:DNA-binding winged helix-turn-helix (wHTH) protein